MSGRRPSKKREEWKDISSEVGFFYSPIREDTRPHRSNARKTNQMRHNKQFALTNYRLVLKSTCNADAYIEDANKRLDWDDVASLECLKGSEAICPICLMPHAVPQATPCGHIFCAACILYYIRNQNEEYVKCPMCNELISLASMRPVAFLPYGQELRENSSVTFYPVIRRHNSRNAYPLENGSSPCVNCPYPYADGAPNQLMFCHVLVSTPHYEYTRLQEALASLRESIDAMQASGEELLRDVALCVQDDLAARLRALEKEHTTLLQPTPPRAVKCVVADCFTYFAVPYSLSHHLHPLCFQLLRSALPDCLQRGSTLQGTVLQEDRLEVTPELLRGNPTLDHLPLYSTAHYLEIDLRWVLELPGLAGHSASLVQKLEERRRQRQRNRAKDKREEKKMSRRIHREEVKYYQEFAPYMLPDTEEQPNTADCNSFPCLPPMQQEKETKTVSVNTAWRGSEHGVIGVNSSLQRSIEGGRFPTLGESAREPQPRAPTMNWSSAVHSESSQKKDKKKKPVVLFSFWAVSSYACYIGTCLPRTAQ